LQIRLARFDSGSRLHLLVQLDSTPITKPRQPTLPGLVLFGLSSMFNLTPGW